MASIDNIRTFLEIAATGNFNRAAENLNITQSTASARIKALEERLDQSLFLRGRGGVELTAAGNHFHRHAVTLLRAWELGKQQVALPSGFTTVFALGAQVSLWERMISKWIPWMRGKCPEAAVHVEADYSDHLMRRLADGLLDAAVLYAPRTTPGLEIERLMEEKLVLVSTRRRGASQGRIEDYVFVDWGEEFRAGHSLAFPEMTTAAVSVWLGAMGLQYILENGGSGYFPLRIVRSYLATKQLYRVPKAPTFQRPAYLVYPTDAQDPKTLGTALDGLRQIAQQERES